jgi:hypothetical protein
LQGVKSDRRAARLHLRVNRPPTPALPPAPPPAPSHNYSITVTNYGIIGKLHNGPEDTPSDNVTASTLAPDGNSQLAPAPSDDVATPASDSSVYDSSSFPDRPNRIWEACAKSYAAFDDGLKWRLPSGTTVEDVVYHAMLEDELPAPVEAMLQNWVIDLNNLKIKSLFSKADLAAIEARVPRLPVANEEFENYLVKFSEVHPAHSRRHCGCMRRPLTGCRVGSSRTFLL